MFPGQGSQRARMAADLSLAPDLFRTAREVIGDDLQPISIEDPKPTWAPERLQPALLITCTAAARALSSRGLRPAGVFGHSLGEFAALVTAEAIDFEDALKLVSLRARAMSRAAQQNPGGMAAVIGLPSASVQEICAEVTSVWAANLNSPSQTVISGTDQALSKAAEQCIRAGASKVIRLEVPMASHCPLMASAAE
ncbi:MAG: ACP S-malonyltransferase, partial [Actinomycetota bacterium]